jgi:phosphatidylglycerol:prolipoprotein diacylglycerol transferase
MPPVTVAAIRIPFDPNIINAGGFILSWHGLLSVVGVAVAVWMVARGARRDGLNTDYVYNTAIWAILGGILGARIVHMADNWSVYSGAPGQWFQIWEGGIGLWGGILGGWLGGLAYAYFAKYPRALMGKLMDLTAPAMLAAQAIGRVGDIINGEHCSTETGLPWGWWFSDVDSPGRTCITNSSFTSQGHFPAGTPATTPVHPTAVYEIIWDVLGLGILYWLRGKLKPHGSLWMFYLAWYSIGRFAIQWLRLDRVHFWSLQEAHIIAIMVLIVAVPFLALLTRRGNPDEDAPVEGPDESGPRSERRRRARASS